MEILREKKYLKLCLLKIRENNRKIGLIPTMGGIHDGHLSLVKQSIRRKLFSVVSVYVNPTQFDKKIDFSTYPRDEKSDLLKLKEIGCDAVYFASDKEIYPNGPIREKKVLKYRNILCDNFRAGHFDGVTTVVERLFKIVNPNYAFFGEKDFQQLKIVETLCKNLNLNIQIISCSSIKTKKGFSLSSRYENLSDKEYKILEECFYEINKLVKKIKYKIKPDFILDCKNQLTKKGISKIEYLEVRSENNLLPSSEIKKTRLFTAFYIGKIRVIDNFILY